MKRPPLQGCMFSRCEAIKEFKCLDLVIPDSVDSDEELRSLLVTMPLIIACSVRVGDEHEKDILNQNTLCHKLCCNWFQCMMRAINR